MNGPVLPATTHTDISEYDRSISTVCKSACRERSQLTSANQNEPQKMTVELIISLQ